ncbi:MAG: TolC family protein [Phycisphaeraceae bacterium]
MPNLLLHPHLALRAPCAAALLLTAALTGCAQPAGPLQQWIEIESTEPTRRALNSAGDLPESRIAYNASASNDDPALPDTAGPEHYVRLALERAPRLRAATQRVARLQARTDQRTSLDDPMLTVSPVGEMAQTAAGEVELMAGVSQRLPWPAKLEARGRVAAQDVAQAAAEWQRLRLEVAGDVRRTYWQLHLAARTLEQLERLRTALEQVRETARSRYEAGQAEQADVLRAGVELAEMDRRIADVRQQRDTAAAMLNRLIDRSPDAALPDPPRIDPQQVALERRALLDQAAADHPAIRRTREQLQGYREQLRLARLNRIPDLTVSANYNAVDSDGLAMSANGDDQWWLGFGVTLPIWSGKYDAAEREARRGMLESLAELDEQQRRIAFEVQSAWLDVISRQHQLDLLREQILPRARQTLESRRAGYQAGRGSFLDVLDAWNRQLSLELVHEQNLADLGRALADLRQAVGGDWPQVNDQPAPSPREDATGVTNDE